MLSSLHIADTGSLPAIGADSSSHDNLPRSRTALQTPPEFVGNLPLFRILHIWSRGVKWIPISSLMRRPSQRRRGGVAAADRLVRCCGCGHARANTSKKVAAPDRLVRCCGGRHGTFRTLKKGACQRSGSAGGGGSIFPRERPPSPRAVHWPPKSRHVSLPTGR